MKGWRLHRSQEHQGKRNTTIDRRLALFEQQASAPRMDRVQWLFGRVYDKHLRPGCLLRMCPCGPPLTRVMLHLVNVGKRFQIDRTLAYSLVLFNAIPKWSRLVKHPDVPMHSLPTE